MAKQLSEFPTAAGRQRGRYDWSSWFNGQPWQLDADSDFAIKPANFQQTVYAAARVRGIKVRTAQLNGGKSVVIQAIKP